LRSNIIHKGSLTIKQDDFEQIRLYCRQSLIKMLGDPMFSSFQDETAFEAWFTQNAKAHEESSDQLQDVL